MVDKIIEAFYKMVNEAQVTGLPPNYCGKPNAKTIIVSDGNTTSNTVPGGWLPFSSKIEMNLGMLLANRAFDLGWVYAHYINPVALMKAKTIVACGTKSELWVKNYVMTGGDSSIELITMPHPIHISHTKAEKLQVITKTFNSL